MEGMSPALRLARLTADVRARPAGTGAKVLIRRVWLGEPRTDLVDAQREVYDSYAGSTAAGFGDDQTVASEDPAELAGPARPGGAGVRAPTPST